MKRILCDQEISTLVLHNKDIIFGTYHYKNKIRAGKIYKYNTESSVTELITETSGTFQIISADDVLYVANASDILIIKKVDLKNSKETSDDENNTNEKYTIDQNVDTKLEMYSCGKPAEIANDDLDTVTGSGNNDKSNIQRNIEDQPAQQNKINRSFNIEHIKTDAMNMSIAVIDNIIVVSQDDGTVKLYDKITGLNIGVINICEHIIWTSKLFKINISIRNHKDNLDLKNKVNNNNKKEMDEIIDNNNKDMNDITEELTLFAGCDCGLFKILTLCKEDCKYVTKEVAKEVKRESGITSIHIKYDLVYVSSYDQHVIIYDLNTFEEIKNIPMYTNVWRMVEAGEYLALACMYDGIKIIDRGFNVIGEFKTDDIAYGIDFVDNMIAFSSFYENIFFITDIQKLMVK